MADYWKSNPKKFCEYCKCWIADNKPSVDFHEKGKRHKENVEKKIDELRKKGVADAKKKQFEEDAFKEMEMAALEAFKKDLVDNPALAKQYGVRIPSKKEPVATCAPRPDDLAPSEDEEKDESPVAEIKEWYEAKSDEGYTYYWNTTTGESVWEAPEKYVSLEEQERLQKGDADTDKDNKTEYSDDKNDKQTEEKIIDPASISLDSIPMPEEKVAVTKIVEDRNARSAYGTWESAVVEEEQIDLQLPQQAAYEEIALPDVTDDEPKLKFKERKVTSLKTPRDGGEVVAFKKRKMSDKKANMRRRGEDDDS